MRQIAAKYCSPARNFMDVLGEIFRRQRVSPPLHPTAVDFVVVSSLLIVVICFWGLRAELLAEFTYTLVYIRDIAHGLADLAEKNDLDFIARLYRMAEMETQQLRRPGR
jgi:hypothetical protein